MQPPAPDPWAVAAAQLGLSYRRTDAAGSFAMRGIYRDREILMEFSPRGWYRWMSDPISRLDRLVGNAPFESRSAIRLATPIRAALPAGLRIGRNPTAVEAVGFALQRVRIRLPSLGQKLRIGAWDHGATRQMLSTLQARHALETLSVQDRASASQDGLVMIRLAPEAGRLRDWLDTCVTVAANLEAAADAEWGRLARERGLELGPFDGEGHRPLAGEIEGVRFQITLTPGGALGADETTIRARLQPLPCRLLVATSAPDGADPPVKTGNPILDAAVEIRCSDPAWARRVLAAPENTGALLGVVHAWPGARLADGLVELSAPEKLGAAELNARIDAILALARALAR